MLKKYFVHKFLLIQIIIGMLMACIPITILMINFYFSGNLEGVLQMALLLIVMIGVFMGIILIPITMLVAKVEIDSYKIRTRMYKKIITELSWDENLTITEKSIGGVKYLVITGDDKNTVLFCYSKNAVKHILSVCSNNHVLNELKLKYKKL